MKIDRIEVAKKTGRLWFWAAKEKEGHYLFCSFYLGKKSNVIAEARWLAKQLGCKLVLPEGGGK